MCALACVVPIAFAAWQWRHVDATDVPAAIKDPGVAHVGVARDVTTQIVRGGEHRVRIHVDELQLERPRVFGPIRLGFARGVTASNVAVDVYADVETGSPPGGSAAMDVSELLRGLLRSLPSDGRALPVELRSYAIRVHDDDGTHERRGKLGNLDDLALD